MALQLVPNSASVELPEPDIEKIKKTLKRINDLLQEVNSNKATDATYESLLNSVCALNELVQTVDNSNDFCKVGGFSLLHPLLSINKPEIRAAAAELIADVLQNNTFCQSRFLETNLPHKLLKLVKEDENVTVCTKSLYALSCLCRQNHAAVGHLETLDALPVLLEVVQRPFEKLRTKAAFLLSNLCYQEPPIRDTLYESGFIPKMVELLKEQHDSSHEHLLSTLCTLVKSHSSAKAQCSKIQPLKDILKRNLEFYNTNEAYNESREYCNMILQLCFVGETC